MVLCPTSRVALRAAASSWRRLPLGFAGRTAVGLGKRVGGRPAEMVTAEIQQRTAEQVFRVLGELKGGAMKFGQAMSIFEAALPEELAAPYRATLTKLQEAAPPMPAATVHEVLAETFGRQWRRRFESFDDMPAAAASIGQVHRAVWKDGTRGRGQDPVPGRRRGADRRPQPGRPDGPDVRGRSCPASTSEPLVAELKERMAEELDYTLEARRPRRRSPRPTTATPTIAVPDVVDGAEQVARHRVDGRVARSREIIAAGTQEERDRAGSAATLRFLFASPARAGLLHADPHPGNFRLLARRPPRRPRLRRGRAPARRAARPRSGGCCALALLGDAETVARGAARRGLRQARASASTRSRLLDLPARRSSSRREHETFHFTRAWMRGAVHADQRPASAENWSTGLKLNLPPEYLLIHRVWLGGIGVLCQLGAERRDARPARALAARLRRRRAAAAQPTATQRSRARTSSGRVRRQQPPTPLTPRSTQVRGELRVEPPTLPVHRRRSASQPSPLLG